jgi:hypothetical protein
MGSHAKWPAEALAIGFWGSNWHPREASRVTAIRHRDGIGNWNQIRICSQWKKFIGID